MSLQTFFESWVLAVYVTATPEKRGQMLEVAKADTDDRIYKAFKATGLNAEEAAND